ncbi:hypothetical protein VA596_34655 [Amycolatopsis sp., V23-08]|uniref:Uncharacterized protein n=1 Tax=Amycolatopsis heterodermiae TaxID=3110235 RepID=A0ABU5RHU6_9PSEU|nr:hypothetical protein [Amycolatopsis sp., V23-08]MEA5364716.1 hypothetical protein [Amycolatopsis sp., V23-08]
MEASDKEGGVSFSERLPFYVVVQLVSVLLPGAALLTEVTVLGIHYARHPGTDLGFLVDALSGIRGAGIVLFAAVGVSGAFVLGYLSRELAFGAMGRIERISRRWTRRKHRAPESWQRVRDLVGDKTADALVEQHHVLKLLDGKGKDLGIRSGAGGGHVADTSLEVFAYSKLWLRGRSAAFRLDFVELEINVLAGLLGPVLLFAVDVLVVGDEPGAVRITAVPVGLLLCAAVLRSIRRLRRTERWEALRNFAFEAAIQQAESKRAIG